MSNEKYIIYTSWIMRYVILLDFLEVSLSLSKDKCEDKPILRNSIHTFQGQLAYKKQDTMFQKENDLVMENYYKQAEKKLEHCMDGLVDGSMSFSDYKRNVKEINGIL